MAIEDFDQVTIAPAKLRPFSKFIMSIGELPTSYLDSMSYAEQVTWFCDYLQNNVIPTLNNNAEALEEVQNLMTQLQEYVDNYFTNLDVQEEINNKLDKMAEDGSLTELIENYNNEIILPMINNQNAIISAQNNTIGNIQSQLNVIGTAGTPLVASSTSGMTDTTKIYVNTTDGKWYYHNGTTWTEGGTYQSTGIDANGVHFYNLDGILDTMLFNNSSDITKLGVFWFSTADNLYNYSSAFFLKKGTTITVSSDFVSKYKWNLKKVNTVTDWPNVMDYSTNTSYTTTEDLYCVFAWFPNSGSWSDETVNRYHQLNNNDITMKYYYPSKNNTLIDLDINFINNSYMIGGSAYGTNFPHGRTIRALNRAGIGRPIKSNYDIKLSLTDKTLYKYGYIIYSSNDDERTGISDTGWITEDRIIPKNTWFQWTIRKADDTNFTNINEFDKILNLTSYMDLNYIYEVLDNEKLSSYYYNGEKLETKNKHGFEISTLCQFTNPMSGGASQGFTIYNNAIVQLFNSTGIQLRDYTTNEIISNISISSIEHGDCCEFSNVKYDENDLLPLLYVCTDATPATIKVIRIPDINTALLVETISLDSGAGYYAGESFDFENNLIYAFGYKNQDYQTSANGNEMIVSVYDMSNKTLISENNYSVELIDRYTIPFLYCIQGQKFFNGKCILLSSLLHAEQHTKIYVFDPIYKRIVTTFDEFNNGITYQECEDTKFILNSNGDYDLVVGSRETYYLIKFKE